MDEHKVGCERTKNDGMPSFVSFWYLSKLVWNIWHFQIGHGEMAFVSTITAQACPGDPSGSGAMMEGFRQVMDERLEMFPTLEVGRKNGPCAIDFSQKKNMKQVAK